MARTAGAKGLTKHKLDIIRVGLKFGIQQKDIAQAMGVTKAAVSAAKKRMEADGTLDTIPFDQDVIRDLFLKVASNASKQ